MIIGKVGGEIITPKEAAIKDFGSLHPVCSKSCGWSFWLKPVRGQGRNRWKT